MVIPQVAFSSVQSDVWSEFLLFWVVSSLPQAVAIRLSSRDKNKTTLPLRCFSVTDRADKKVDLDLSL